MKIAFPSLRELQGIAALLSICLASLPLSAQLPTNQMRQAKKNIEPANMQHASAQGSGVLEFVAVNMGDTVAEGQLLGYLNHERELHTHKVVKARAKSTGPLRIAQATVKKHAATLDDVRTRHRRRLASDSDLLRAEADHEIAQGQLDGVMLQQELLLLELEQAEKALAKRFFYAPMNGQVILVTKGTGDKVNEGDKVFTIADISRLSTSILVPAEALDKIREGTSIPVQIAGSSLLRFGRVDAISPVADGAQQLLKISFPNFGTDEPGDEPEYDFTLPEGVEPIPPPPPPPPAAPAQAKPAR